MQSDAAGALTDSGAVVRLHGPGRVSVRVIHWRSSPRGGRVSQEIRVGVVGTGDWGANLVRNFAAIPGAKLAGLCDSDPDRLRRTAAQYPTARVYPRVDDLAADAEIQAAVVAASAV